jgi:hypothetical protein
MIIKTILDTTAGSVTPGSIVSTDSRPVGKGIVTVEVSGTGSNAPALNINGKLVYPVVDPVRNLLPYSTDPWDSPGLSPGDLNGEYWFAPAVATASFSSIEMPGADTNPFGGTSCIELSANDSIGSNWSRLYNKTDDVVIAAGSNPTSPRIWKEDYWTIFSMYIKKPPSLGTSSLMMYNYDPTTPDNKVHRAEFVFLGDGIVPTVLATTTGTYATATSAVNDWYRVTTATSGLVDSDTQAGDMITNYIYQGAAAAGDAADAELTRMWLYGLQLEQKPIGSFNASAATFYQEVAGAKRVPEDDTVIGWSVIAGGSGSTFDGIASNTTVGSEVDIYPTMGCTLASNSDNKRIVVKIAYPDALAKK